MKKISVFLILIGLVDSLNAQSTLDSIQQLDEILVSDTKLNQYATGIKIQVLNDSVLRFNSKSLTEVLALNSNLYFKENGYGMVSSPSFRGTNASQTTVVWNGININSQLNGQTDFSTINTNNFNSIAIRSGGGSVQYGSGAIGGSIHLNNKLAFNKHFGNKAFASYGSFNTKQVGFNSSYGSDKFSVNGGLFYIDSDNDYKYLGTDKVNENGEFGNVSLNFNLGYFVSGKDVLKLYHQTFVGDRNFSGTLNTVGKSRYEDQNFRSMLEWSHISNSYTSRLKVAHLQEQFKYYENKDNNNHTFGKINTYLVNYNFNRKISENFQFKTILDYNKFIGTGSNFGDPERTVFSVTGLLNHKLNERFEYNVNLRKDFTSGFKSPFVFSADGSYKASEHYRLTLNGSKNYRVPTFNDLYWVPGGNLNLVPESSYQIDFGQEIIHELFTLNLNGYYIKTENLIQWRPTSGAWSPANVSRAQSYGVELELQMACRFNNHHFTFNSHYSYTVSENLETQKQLIYVPFHKGNFSLGYNYKNISAYYQFMYNGDVFTTDDNLSGPFYSVEDYNISNLGLNYEVFNEVKQQLVVGVLVKNIFNTNYQSIAFRPMPNRNFNIQINYKF
ncbi:TonB-dependent receptor [Flavobacteriaceae bacterium GSB9]|nr:TonB-dependent receptor [Flavobacteriaceae bacterium GSB9]